ncbi:hypothetical protein J8J14_15000 [Roseomonas sp. SSH11]|uniref:Uncharacterized protein n=1 Tax=Pararoseomonas baculiformis TaxID=2820812 RepID=A0ABS4AHS3_9PROT|nr:hypothetical protein [Pararoseomonas baculiformis]MBP0446080.1 hypothetical protein [Pararoseomonas baculiformis]
MQVGRLTMMLLLAALLAVPVAYAQMSAVLDGAGVLMTGFGGTGFHTASLPQ